MSLSILLQRIRQHPDDVQLTDVMDVIAEHYDYTPTAFRNGVGDDQVDNAAGRNEGSCKLFAFARLHGLDEAQTLACFGDYYRRDVLENPHGSDHANIRAFMRHGWAGIRLDQPALRTKSGA